MQGDPDGIGKECLPKQREWAEANTSAPHMCETAVTDDAIELTRVVAFRLKG